MLTSITGYTKSRLDTLLAGKVDTPSGAAQGYVPTVNAEGGITYAPPAGGDPAKRVTPAFVFTYDDGDDSIYTVGQPLFTAKGVPATAFVILRRERSPNAIAPRTRRRSGIASQLRR